MGWKRVLVGRWSWKRPLYSLLAIYVMLGSIAVFFADRLIFLPPAATYTRELDGLRELALPSGGPIAAIHHPARPGMPTLLYSHGNAEDLGGSTLIYDEWRSRGFGVLAYDYPGYGLSRGRPTEATAQEAILAAWTHLGDQGVLPSSVIIVGRSVGSGPSVWLASRVNAAGLILIAPFTSTFAVPFRATFFPRDRFPNLKRIRGIHSPLLVLHGDADGVIPPVHGRKLAAASPSRDKAFVLVPSAGHDDLFLEPPGLVFDHIAAFALRAARSPGEIHEIPD